MILKTWWSSVPRHWLGLLGLMVLCLTGCSGKGDPSAASPDPKSRGPGIDPAEIGRSATAPLTAADAGGNVTTG